MIKNIYNRCSILLLLFLLFTYIFININISLNKKKIEFIFKDLNIINNELIVFSCFYDKRFNALRLIGVSSSINNFSCSYKMNNINRKCKYKYVIFNRDSSGNNYKLKYINIKILLKNDSNYPSKIKIDNKYFTIFNYNSTSKINALCITTFKYFTSYNLFIQSLRIYQRYGITDVFIYSSDYQFDFNTFSFINNIKIHIIYIENEYYLYKSFYFGQIVKYNDCLYRNMYIANYIIFADYDELIVLNKIKKFEDLFKSMKQADIYYFRSAICPTIKNIEKKKFHMVKDVNLNNTYNCCIMNSFYHRKYIITSPNKFIKINVHYIDYFFKKYRTVYVQEKYGYIHHSRIPTFLLMNKCVNWFYDNSLYNLIN